MHISRIELENIKSHASAVFEFPKGTTAITGDNGAGKTSIIEAVAWVLFDLLEYKKEDFVRRGAKKGWVLITFESGIDGREYEVYRDSGAGYHVTDPRLRTRIANKKEEVFRFLWQHLGLEPGTDLRSLFRQAIGVPQGTFTAIFLEGATERKVAFDRLLKVEEYRQAAEKLRETSRFVDNGIATLREQIARSDGELSRAASVKEELGDLTDEITRFDIEVKALHLKLADARSHVQALDQIEKASYALERAKEALDRALDAADKVKAVRSGYDKYIEAVNELVNLERQRAERDGLEKSFSESSVKLAKLTSEQVQHAKELDAVEKARREIEELKPKANEQRLLEEEIATRGHDIKSAKPMAKDRIESIDRELGLMRQRFLENRGKMEEAGNDLLSAEKDGNKDLVRQIQNRIKVLELRVREWQEDADQMKVRRSKLEIQLSEAEQVRDRLKELGNPIARIEFLTEQIERDAAIRTELSKVETRLDMLAKERDRLIDEMARFLDLNKTLSRSTSDRDENAEAHRTFLIFDSEANALEPRQQAVKMAENAVQKIRKSRSAGTTEDVLDYDARAHSQAREDLLALERQHSQIEANLITARRRRDQLESEKKRLATLRASLANDAREKQRLETVAEACGFIRDTLKEAAPRVARNYVHHVSLEANQMYREITGDAERTLKWGDDYSVSLEEEGFERPFQSLSGGEQMAAALSVRLALLKQLSDIRIAFFDEPTTNMDAERRENFALEISRIKHFDQLFVISHDETFDNYVDNVVHVERGRTALA